jgi:uncharacterized protein YndB with AHSA1/START domain
MTIHLSITINAPASEVFTIVADLPTYHNWLPESSAFKGTTQVSHNPVKLGTTYHEPGPAGTRKGEVIEFEPPGTGKTGKITFKQPMSMKPYVLGMVLDVKVEMTVTEERTEDQAGVKTVLKRDVSLSYPWALWALKPFIDAEFKKESLRTLESLKAYAEGLGQE